MGNEPASHPEWAEKPPSDFDQLYKLVKEMREAQKKHWKSRLTSKLTSAKIAEKKVDEWIFKYENPNYVRRLF